MRTNSSFHLSESHLLTKAFQENRSLVVLISYDGKRYVRIRKVTQYNLLIQDELPISKLEVVMAYASEDQTRIKPDHLLDNQVKALNQKPIKKIRDRRIVNMVVAVGDPVRIVLRTGDVVTGFCKAVSRYNILLDVRGASVLIYKHGIHELKNYRTPPSS
ncbi:hypothetical protein F4X10_23060 [Candidatus Poribacteria bacterium]|nr:hypothetical protein [Candidatus Poribacteria bacterium]